MRNVWSLFPEMVFGESDDIDDSESLHGYVPMTLRCAATVKTKQINETNMIEISPSMAINTQSSKQNPASNLCMPVIGWLFGFRKSRHDMTIHAL